MARKAKPKKQRRRSPKKSALRVVDPTPRRLCAVEWNGPHQENAWFREEMVKMGHPDLAVSPQLEGCAPSAVVFTFVAAGDTKKIEKHFERPETADELVLFDFPDVPAGLDREDIVRLLDDRVPPRPDCEAMTWPGGPAVTSLWVRKTSNEIVHTFGQALRFQYSEGATARHLRREALERPRPRRYSAGGAIDSTLEAVLVATGKIR